MASFVFQHTSLLPPSGLAVESLRGVKGDGGEGRGREKAISFNHTESNSSSFSLPWSRPMDYSLPLS